MWSAYWYHKFDGDIDGEWAPRINVSPPYAVIFESKVVRAITHLHVCRDFFVSDAQISTAACTLWSLHTYSTEWSRGRCERVKNNSDMHNNTVQLLCVHWLVPTLTVSPLYSLAMELCSLEARTFDTLGVETKADTSPLMIGHFPAPHMGVFSVFCLKVLLDRGPWFLGWCLHAAPALCLSFINNPHSKTGLAQWWATQPTLGPYTMNYGPLVVHIWHPKLEPHRAQNSAKLYNQSWHYSGPMLDQTIFRSGSWYQPSYFF